MLHIDRDKKRSSLCEIFITLVYDNQCQGRRANGCHRSRFADRFGMLKYAAHPLNSIFDGLRRLF